MRRCVVCSERVWPWQRYGEYHARAGVIRWHAAHPLGVNELAVLKLGPLLTPREHAAVWEWWENDRDRRFERPYEQ